MPGSDALIVLTADGVGLVLDATGWAAARGRPLGGGARADVRRAGRRAGHGRGAGDRLEQRRRAAAAGRAARAPHRVDGPSRARGLARRAAVVARVRGDGDPRGRRARHRVRQRGRGERGVPRGGRGGAAAARPGRRAAPDGSGARAGGRDEPRGPALRGRRPHARPPGARRRRRAARLRGQAQPGARAAAHGVSARGCTCGRTARAAPAPTAPTSCTRARRASGSPRAGVHAVHTAWSGNHVHYAERVADRRVQLLGGGELLLPGEIRLATDETYTSPWLYGAFGDGLDEVARRFHRHLRARPRPVSARAAGHPQRLGGGLLRPRPRPAARPGRPGGRRSASSASSSTTAGSAPAATTARASATGWCRTRSGRTGCTRSWTGSASSACSSGCGSSPRWSTPTPTSRGPTRSGSCRRGRNGRSSRATSRCSTSASPSAYAHVKDADPRDARRVRHRLHQVGPQPRPHRGGHADRRRTARRARPDAGVLPAAGRAPRRPSRTWRSSPARSGGARIDLAVLERTDRVWVSDNIDPHDRQRMLRWTGQLVPPEYLGSHIASGRSHVTGRVHDLGFRAGTALFGHLGIEWDLAQAIQAGDRRADGLDRVLQGAARVPARR